MNVDSDSVTESETGYEIPLKYVCTRKALAALYTPREIGSELFTNGSYRLTYKLYVNYNVIHPLSMCYNPLLTQCGIPKLS
jgi:hypothetical protein